MLRAFTAVAIPAMAIIADAPIATGTGFTEADSVFGGSLLVLIIVQDGSTPTRTSKPVRINERSVSSIHVNLDGSTTICFEGVRALPCPARIVFVRSSQRSALLYRL